MSITINLEIGHEASLRPKTTAEGFTHDWEVYVRGCNGAEIHYYVEKVVFHLHETFPKPKRVVKEPPYSLKTSGYAGFNLPIDIYLRSNQEPRKIRFNYDLQLQPTGPTLYKVQKEKYVFHSPPEDLKNKLLKGGAVVGSSQELLETRSNIDDRNQMTSKPKLGGQSSAEVKKIKARPEERDSFQDLFGTPIKTSKLTPDLSKLNKESTKNAPKPDKALDKSKTKSPHKDREKNKEKPSSERSGDKKSTSDKKSKDKTKERDRSKEKSSKRDKSPAIPSRPVTTASPTPPPTKRSPKNNQTKDKDATMPKEQRDKREEKKSKKEKREHKENKHKERVEHKESTRSKEPKPNKEAMVKDNLIEQKTEKKDKTKELLKDVKDEDKSEKSRPEKSEEKVKHKHKKKDKDRKEKKEEKSHKSQEKKSLEKPSVFTKENGKDAPKVETLADKSSLFGSPKSDPPPPAPKKPLTSLMTSLVDEDSSNSSKNSSRDSSPLPTPPPVVEVIKKEPEVSKIKNKEETKDRKKEKKQRKEKKTDKEHEKRRKRKAELKLEQEGSPPVKKDREEDLVNNNSDDERKVSSSEDAAVGLNISAPVAASAVKNETEDYMSTLRALQRKIMDLRDNSDLQKVVQLIAETGRYEVSAHTFDFDLCLLDRSTVRQLQDFFSSIS